MWLLSYTELTGEYLVPNISIVRHTQVKGKAISLQALRGPEGSRRLKLPDFKTIGT
jgi:hypothetical protein